jgi:integrase
MKFTTEDALKDKEVKAFFQSRRIKGRTERRYAQSLAAYAKFCGKSPSELIEEAENEEEDRIRMKNRRIRSYFYDFHDYVRKDLGKSQNTIRNHFTVIRGFYRFSDIEIPSIVVTSKSEQNLSKRQEIIKKEDIRKALKLCTLRYQAIILLMSSSGMAGADVRHLTYGDFLDAISDYLDREVEDVHEVAAMLKKKKNIVPIWKKHRMKTGVYFITFSTPESVNAIITYLLDQEKNNKPITGRDHYLFGYQSEPMNRDTFTKYFTRLNKRCGFGNIGKYGYFTSHTLRAYFGTIMHNNEVAVYDYKKMMGKTIPPDMEPYVKPDEKHLQQQYLKAINDLSMDRIKIKTVTSKEYDSLISQLNSKDEEMAEMKEDLQYLKNIVDMYNDPKTKISKGIAKEDVNKKSVSEN